MKSLKQPSDHFIILNYVAFSNSRTRSATAHKLLHNYSSNKISNFYFNHLPRLWNALPPINTELHFNTIKLIILFTSTCGTILQNTLIQVIHAHIISFALVIITATVLLPLILIKYYCNSIFFPLLAQPSNMQNPMLSSFISRSLRTFANLLFMAKMPPGTGMSNIFRLKKH